MATKEEHLVQAATNEILANTLAEMGEAAWGSVVLLYAAVHLIQAYLTTIGSLPKSHAAREVLILRTRTLQPIERHYTILKQRSEDARYDCESFTRQDFDDVRIRYGRLQGHMQRLLS